MLKKIETTIPMCDYCGDIKATYKIGLKKRKTLYLCNGVASGFAVTENIQEILEICQRLQKIEKYNKTYYGNGPSRAAKKLFGSLKSTKRTG